MPRCIRARPGGATPAEAPSAPLPEARRTGDRRPSDEYAPPSAPAPRREPGAPREQKRESGVQRLKKLVAQLRGSNADLQLECSQMRVELQHYRSRVLSGTDSHRLECARLRKEVEYHKRLRQGAEQRTAELDDRLRQQQRQTSSFDETQNSLIEQSQVLITKNSELTHKLGMMEAQVTQLQGLKECLEAELMDVYADRDRLAELLEQVMAAQHAQHASLGGALEGLAEDEEDGEEGDEGDDDVDEGDDNAGGAASAGGSDGAAAAGAAEEGQPPQPGKS